MPRSGPMGKLSWKRLLAAVVLALPVSLAGLIMVGMLGHGNRGVFLAIAWLLAPLPTIADRLHLSDGMGLAFALLQLVLWTLLIERGIARALRPTL